MKRLSIVIPTYRGEDSLPIALASLCRQTYTDIEVIVSDDNGIGTDSQKATAKICDSYKGRLDLIYVANPHVNGSHARNEGLKRATGDYISLLDDDDIYMPEYAAKAIKAFEGDADLVFFDVAILTREGVSRTVRNDDIGAVDLLFYHKEIGTGSNICMRREVYEEDGGFDERYLRSQDIEFTVKKLHRYRSVWVDSLEIVKYYNRTDNFPDYKRSLDTYALLREDMRERGIIDIETRERLYRRQLHGLFNDLLVKRAPKKDIAVIYGLLKKEGILSFTDKATYLVYGMSPGLFRIIFDIYMSLRNRNDESEATELLEYRKSLEEEVR